MLLTWGSLGSTTFHPSALHTTSHAGVIGIFTDRCGDSHLLQFQNFNDCGGSFTVYSFWKNDKKKTPLPILIEKGFLNNFFHNWLNLWI